ncbi:MAG: class B sortase [Acutalibacteraceae bacterium]|nr:class B sortase [Acutalibacteraceae bacterium]
MKNKRFVLKLLLFILTIGIVISSYNVCSVLLEYKKTSVVYDDISSFAVSPEKETNKDTTNNGLPNISINFENLKQINPDIKGWLYNEALGVNYPVIQGNDNSQYLKHLPTGEYSESGTLFFDFRTDITAEHILVYGHNMYNGSMFGGLQKYTDQEFYNQHPTFYYYEENNTYKLNVISAHYTNDTDFTYTLGEQLDMEKYVEYIKEKSCIKTDVKYRSGDSIITFSTCAYLKSGNRFVVHCKVEKI